MREAGTEKLKRADLEDANRIRIQTKKLLTKREEITEDTPAVDVKWLKAQQPHHYKRDNTHRK